ncbi:DNA adenine methylase, partial [Escherichia coli]
MKRQYAANYHILETLARGDEPEAIGISGLRPWRDQYSNFCTKTKIRDSFKEIITNMGCNEFLISYSEDGLLTIEDFNKLLADFGDVKIEAFTHKRFRSNK